MDDKHISPNEEYKLFKRMLFKQRSKSTDNLEIKVHENFKDLKPVYD